MDNVLIAVAMRVSSTGPYEEWCGPGNDSKQIDLGAPSPAQAVALKLATVAAEVIKQAGGSAVLSAAYVDYGKGYARVVNRFVVCGETKMVSVFYMGDKAL